MKKLLSLKRNSFNSRTGGGYTEDKRVISWSKYLVSSGGEIKEEGEENWSADMSQLLVGSRFASGRHSRIYHGIYKEKEVAVKIVSVPEEDDALAALVEKQFNSEVSLLFGLKHPNIISVIIFHIWKDTCSEIEPVDRNLLCLFRIPCLICEESILFNVLRIPGLTATRISHACLIFDVNVWVSDT